MDVKDILSSVGSPFSQGSGLVLERLHRDAQNDRKVFLRSAPAAFGAWIRGRSPIAAAIPYLKDAYLPVSPEMGRFLQITARLAGAKTIVEFGSSFGISAIYLASGLMPGGRFIGSEREPNKVIRARKNLAEAGLSEVAEIREGDAMETLSDIEGPIDILFLDGWKDLYLPLLQKLKPKLRPGSLVMADNVYTFKRDLAPFVMFMQDPQNGFASVTLPFSSGLEYAVAL
ncbi:MAG: class I SAM-dependent methyltransferase [Leptospirales bacterium]|nr:class I SAM-dependent methyltransferase [Leptospirales bacterium]